MWLIFALLLCTACASPYRTVNTNEITTNLAGDPPTLNGMLTDDSDALSVTFVSGGYLFRADPNGRLVPEFAVTVPTLANGGISRDGLRIHYRLRRGARWSDGAPFTSRDVVYSFKTAMDPRTNVPDRSGFEEIASVRASGPYGVDVQLRRPYSPGIYTYFALTANDPYPILPAHILEGVRDINTASFNARPITLGPFIVSDWLRSDRVDLAPNPYYFRPVGLKRIVLKVIPNDNSLLNMWRTHELDMMSLNGERDLSRLAGKAPDTVLHIFDRNLFHYVLFQLQRPILNDTRVRQALVSAIDRRRIMRLVFGAFQQDADGDRLPGQFAYDAAIAQPPFEPAKAGALLDAAGWRKAGRWREKEGRRLRLELAISNSIPSRRFSVLLQQQLAQLGIEIFVRSYSSELLNAPQKEHGILASGNFDLAFSGWFPGGIHDHSYLYRCDTRPPNGENFGRICDPEIDRAARTELETADPAVEAAADRTMLRRLIAQSDLLFLGFGRAGVALRRGFEGYRPSAIERNFWNPWAWHWETRGNRHVADSR